MGLKFETGEVYEELLQIKIRPLWDWNYIATYGITSSQLIKIRPLWDWN